MWDKEHMWIMLGAKHLVHHLKCCSVFVKSSATPRTHSQGGLDKPPRPGHHVWITAHVVQAASQGQGLLVCSQVYSHKITSFLPSREEAWKSKGDSCLSCNFYQQQSS